MFETYSMVPSPLTQAKPLVGSLSVTTESGSPSASVSLPSTSNTVKSPARTGAESGFATGAVLPATTWDCAVIPAHSLSGVGAAVALEVIANPDRRSERIATVRVLSLGAMVVVPFKGWICEMAGSRVSHVFIRELHGRRDVAACPKRHPRVRV